MRTYLHKKSQALLLVLGLLAVTTAHGQDPQFTQFYANPMYLNPAFAGSKICPRVNLNYRNQWPAIPGQFVSYAASYDQHIDALSGGLGGMVWHDQAGNGTIQTTNISAIYSYTLKVTQEFNIRAGFQASYYQKSVNWDNLRFGDMIDPRFGFIYETQETPGTDNVNYADFSVGFLGYSEKFFAGFVVHHMTEPTESFFTQDNAVLYSKFTAHAGANIPLDNTREAPSLSPNILYQRQGAAEQVLFGMYGKTGPLVAGLWYRNKDAFIALLGIQLEKFRFGYSYDLTISQLTMQPGGSHEISVGLQLNCPRKRRPFQPLNCPEF